MRVASEPSPPLWESHATKLGARGTLKTYSRGGGALFAQLDTVAAKLGVAPFTLRQSLSPHQLHDVPALKWHLVGHGLIPATARGVLFLTGDVWRPLLNQAQSSLEEDGWGLDNEAEEQVDREEADECFGPALIDEEATLSPMEIDEDSLSSSEEDAHEVTRLQRLPKALGAEWD